MGLFLVLMTNRSKDSLAYRIYGKNEIKERHRHRYEINTEYLEEFEKHGLVFTGCDLEKERMEVICLINFWYDTIVLYK